MKWADIGLRTKILSVLGLLIAFMALVLSLGGFVMLHQADVAEEAAARATQRVEAATKAQRSILEMDRGIQALIAADEPDMIRAAAIGSIRAGAGIDENLAILGKVFVDDAGVKLLSEKMAEIRPKQMEVIAAARSNEDAQALQLASTMAEEFRQIADLAQDVTKRSQSSVLTAMTEVRETSRKQLTLLGVVCAAGLGFALLAAWLWANAMSRSIGKIESAIQALAEGDLSRDLDVSRVMKDEIGRTFLAIQNTISRLRGLIQSVGEAAGQVSSEANAINESAEGLRGAAQHMDQSSRSINTQTGSLSAASSNAFARLGQAGEEATAVSAVAAHSSDELLKTVDSFQNFRKEVQATSDKSRTLSDQAGQIQSITQTIKIIAEQTNLLALNAAIEAARAGEHGRGFAVVADEVRKLAGNTENAVNEIATLVAGIDHSINDTVDAMGRVLAQTDSNIEQLRGAAAETRSGNERIQSISQAMQDIVGLVRAQEQATESIASDAEQLTGIAAENRAQANSLGSHSQSLGEAAVELSNALSNFKY